MRTRESIQTLLQELNGAMEDLERAAILNSRAWERIRHGAHDVLDYGALAFTIHNCYGVLENYFLRVAKFFENNLPADSWHKTLVERMALDIPGLRPALVPNRAVRSDLTELLVFRHRFRNLYGEDLDPGKTAAVQSVLLRVLEQFPQVHREFSAKLSRIANQL